MNNNYWDKRAAETLAAGGELDSSEEVNDEEFSEPAPKCKACMAEMELEDEVYICINLLCEEQLTRG